MHITWNELTIAFDPEKSEALLADWRWLVGDDVQIILVSALGDLFLADQAGNILWLDVGVARLTQIAASREEFLQFMQQPANANEWFIPNLIGDLITAGQQLTAGQCYSYKVPPMLSGRIELINFEPADLLVHCSMFGQIGQKIQHLPEGTKIDNISISKSV